MSSEKQEVKTGKNFLSLSVFFIYTANIFIMAFF